MLFDATTQVTRQFTAIGFQRITSIRPKRMFLRKDNSIQRITLARDDEQFVLSSEQAQLLLARWPDVCSSEHLASPLESLSVALGEVRFEVLSKSHLKCFLHRPPCPESNRVHLVPQYPAIRGRHRHDNKSGPAPTQLNDCPTDVAKWPVH